MTLYRRALDCCSRRMLALSKSWWVFSCLDGIHADSFSEIFRSKFQTALVFFLPFFLHLYLFCLIHRWGFIQFSTDAVNKSEFVRTPNWPVYSGLVMLYDAEKVNLISIIFLNMFPVFCFLIESFTVKRSEWWGEGGEGREMIACPWIVKILYLCFVYYSDWIALGKLFFLAVNKNLLFWHTPLETKKLLLSKFCPERRNRTFKTLHFYLLFFLSLRNLWPWMVTSPLT